MRTLRGNLLRRRHGNARLLDFVGRERLVVLWKEPVVAPRRKNEVQDIGNLLVLEVAQRSHHRVVLVAADFDRSSHAIQNVADEMRAATSHEHATGVSGEGRGEGREGPAVGSVAARTELRVDLLSAFRLKLLGRRLAGGEDNYERHDQSSHKRRVYERVVIGDPSPAGSWWRGS